jgi:hypothetical protein
VGNSDSRRACTNRHNLNYLGEFYKDEAIGFRQKREMRRTANNGHFLRKHGNEMYVDKDYEYDVGEKYEGKICVSCGKGVEDSTHFLFECEPYQEIRDRANNLMNINLENNKVRGQHNLLKVYGESFDWARKRSKGTLEHKLVQTWKGYITKDTRTAIRKAVGKEKVSQTIQGMIGIISAALLDMKEKRNEYFHTWQNQRGLV